LLEELDLSDEPDLLEELDAESEEDPEDGDLESESLEELELLPLPPEL
jgi:hypothetical protein